jgi:hypothetical protein
MASFYNLKYFLDETNGRKNGEFFEEKVVVYSDVSSPYEVVLVSLSAVMMKRDGVIVETPSIPEGGPIMQMSKKGE